MRRPRPTPAPREWYARPDRLPNYAGCAPVDGIEPVAGWALVAFDEQDGDRFWTPAYVARHPDHDDELLDVSRFRFTPSQERFAWLVRHGFPAGGWDDTAIEHAMEQERKAA